MTSDPFLCIGQQPISLEQAIQYLQRGEAFEAFVGEVVRQYALDQALAAPSCPAIEEARVDQAVANFRQQQQLNDPAAFETWLASASMTRAQLYDQIKAGLQLEALKTAIALPKLQQYFIERKLYLDRVVLSRIIVEDKDMAEELRHQVLEGHTSFEGLARDYSITDDRIVNGMVGPVSRGTMPDTLRAIVDEASAGDLVGPITMDQRWGLFRIEALLPASLEDDTLKQALIDELFEQWLAAKIEALPIQLQIAP